MRAGKWALVGAAMLFVTSIAANAVLTSPVPPNPPLPMPATDVVAARQSTFLLSGALFGSMKGAIDRGEDVKGQGFAARSLARWAKTLPVMFPAAVGGTAQPTSKALPNIWTDRAGFEAKAASYAAEADKLAALAGANDKVGFATQWNVVRGTCAACHDVYRTPDEPAPKPAG